MAFGLSSTGFEKKRLADIKTEIEAKFRVVFGPFINLMPSSVISQVVGVFADREASLWELAEDVYNSQYPDTADGASLDNVVAITGIVRLAATKSVIPNQKQLLFGTSGTLVPAGTILSVDGNPLAKFLTDVDVTLVTGVDEVQTLSFSVTPVSGTWKLSLDNEETSALAFNISAVALQTALNGFANLSGVTVSGSMAAGFTVTFAGADGKQDQSALVVSDNSLSPATVPTVLTTVPGVNQGAVSMTAQSTGPVLAIARTLTVIDTPVAGLASTKNIIDATIGRNTETDLELRIRRQQTLQLAGAGTVEAIRSQLLALTGVTAVIVFENTSDVEIDGRPPHSFEAVVQGGVDQEIADAIWESKPAGIQSFGNQSDNVTDSQGVVRVINWSRPTTLPIYLTVDLTTDPTLFPVNGQTLAQQALIARGDSFGIGKTVIVYPTLISALEDIPGITDVVMKIGLAPSPTLDNNIPIDANEIADFDTSRTTVNIF